jgi:hypothetical protein
MTTTKVAVATATGSVSTARLASTDYLNGELLRPLCHFGRLKCGCVGGGKRSDYVVCRGFFIAASPPMEMPFVQVGVGVEGGAHAD